MIEEEIQVAGRDTAKQAKSFAPVAQSALKTSIRAQSKGKTSVVGTDVQYAPYVEFGTGRMVNVPSELQEYAMQFKGAGIRQVNTRSQPYLYPAFFINRERLKDRTKKKIEDIFRQNSRR
jgi:HK97 gp10 family phage protein